MSDMATTIDNELGMRVRRITVDEYHRMGDAGIFPDDERFELLGGLLIAMPPIGFRHEFTSRSLTNLLGRAFSTQGLISMNSPLTLATDSEPQPDVMVLRPPLTRYQDRLPLPSDVLLLVEVADTLRKGDRGPKARAYGEAGIEEVWVVDLVEEEVVVLRSPGSGGFESTSILRRGDRIAPARFPDVVLAVSDFLASAAPTR